MGVTGGNVYVRFMQEPPRVYNLNASYYKRPYILKLGSVLVALAGDIMVPCVSPASKGRSELP